MAADDAPGVTNGFPPADAVPQGRTSGDAGEPAAGRTGRQGAFARPATGDRRSSGPPSVAPHGRPAAAGPSTPAPAEEAAAEIVALLRTLRRRSARRALQDCQAAGGGPEAFLPFAWPLLHHLRRSPGQTVSGLARTCGLSKSRASVLAEALHAGGFLEKRPDPADQRILRLYVTARADEVWGPRPFQDALIELVADLDPADREQLLRALRRMREGAERRGW